MGFPSGSGGKENKQIECIVADIFLCRLVTDLHSTNLVFIALRADIFFWIVGVIGRSYSLARAMFGLFGDTESNVTTGSAIRMKCVEKADPRLCSRSDDTGPLLFFQPFLRECRRRK